MDRLAAERAQLQKESSELAEKIGAIDQQTEQLKIEMATADADKNISPSLDMLAADRLYFSRRLDGLRLLISRLDARRNLLQPRARELAQAADQDRQDQVARDFEEKTEKLSRRIVEHWTAACSDSFELCALLDTANAEHLDPEHKAACLAIGEKLYGFFMSESLRVINEPGWEQHRTHMQLFQRLQIVPARRKS